MAATSFASGNVPYTDFTLPRTAAADGISGVNPNKLWLPLWSGEVIHAYDQYNMFESMVTTKSLTGGVTWEFPVTGVVGLNPSWNSGVELGAYSGDTNSTSSSFKVSLDKRPMAAHFETDNIDALITQWDFRSELARQSGITLANTRDKQLAVSLLAACAVPSFTNDPRPNISSAFQNPAIVAASNTAANCDAGDALKCLEEIENYLVACQENDVMVGTVYCVVRPKVFQVIRALGIPRATDKFANNPLFTGGQAYGGSGSGFDGMNGMTDSLDYMGVKIVKSNHLPSTAYNVTANNIGSSKYNLNASATSYVSTGTTQGFTGFSVFGIIFQTDAVAGLSLQGMKVDSIADVRRNTQFTVASMMKGTGIIKPEVCKALIGASAGTATRAVLFAHLDGNSVSGTKTQNLANGFGAEYMQVA